MDEDLEKVTVRLPPGFLKALDFLVEVDDFPSRSEAIRCAVRDMIYMRVDTVMDKIRKLAEAEKALMEIKEFKRDYMNK